MLTALRIIAAASVVVLVLLFLRMILRPLRRWLDREMYEPAKHQARVCPHCGRERTPGTYPPIAAPCPPEVTDCPRPYR